MSNVNVSITENTTTVTTVDEIVEITISNTGPQGADGQGVPQGGTTGQILAKNSGTNYDTGWIDNFTPTVKHLVKNDGTALSKGAAVYISGANGTNMIVSPASNTSDTTSAETIGLLETALAVNAQGYVITEGLLSGLNTSTATAGDPVWLGVNGALLYGLANKPVAPAHLVFMGVVTRAHATQGEIFVHISNGWELEELHNVLITNPTNNQVLTYEASSGLWKNKDNAADGVTSLTVSAPLTGGTITSTGTIGLNQSALSIANTQVTGLGTASTKDIPATGNASTSQVVYGTDTRLSDSRTPTAHAASHASAGSDPVTLAQSQVTNLTTDLAAKAALTATQTFTGTQTLIPSAITNIPLIIKALSGQTGNLFEAQNSSGTWQTRIKGDGTLVALTTSTGSITSTSGSGAYMATNNDTGSFTVFTNAAANKGLVVKGAASQSANLQEWQDSAGTVYASLGPTGTFNFGTSSFISAGTGRAVFVGTTIGVPVLTTKAPANMTSDILQMQNSASTVLGGRNALAQIYTGSTSPILTAVGGATTAASGTGTTATITTTSAHNLAVGDLVTVAGVTPIGYNGTYVLTAVTSTTLSYANATTGAQTVAGTVSAPAQASITARSAGTTGAIIKLAASASNDALQVQNSSATKIMAVDASGQTTAAAFFTTNQFVRSQERNSGGEITLARQTAVSSNPGANIARLYFRDGTNAGTLKLVVRAGAAGAETTILDNIPQ